MQHDAIEAQVESEMPRSGTKKQRQPAKNVTKNTSEARNLASDLENSTSRTEIPIRKIFVRRDNPSNTTPLLEIYRGGKGGEVALKLYIALLWKAVAEPFEIKNVSGSGWAALLGLYDSSSTPEEKNAARERINKALRKLKKLRLIELVQQKGTTPIIRILTEDMSGDAYIPPSQDAFKRKIKRVKSKRTEDFYFKVPTNLWTSGKIHELSGAALVMYLIIAAEFGASSNVWFSTESFPERYGISSSTRARGTRELEAEGLLRVGRQRIDRAGRSLSMEVVRSRKTYRLRGWEP